MKEKCVHLRCVGEFSRKLGRAGKLNRSATSLPTLVRRDDLRFYLRAFDDNASGSKLLFCRKFFQFFFSDVFLILLATL